jgi:hypothetical protein
MKSVEVLEKGRTPLLRLEAGFWGHHVGRQIVSPPGLQTPAIDTRQIQEENILMKSAIAAMNPIPFP